jgi:hypothetical protein
MFDILEFVITILDMFIFMFVFLAVRHIYIFVCKTVKTGKITILNVIHQLMH